MEDFQEVYKQYFRDVYRCRLTKTMDKTTQEDFVYIFRLHNREKWLPF